MQSFSTTQYAEHIFRLTRNMYTLAEDGDWEAFTILESKRQPVINSLFENIDITTELNQIAGILGQVVEMDAASIALGEMEKQRMGSELNMLKNRKQAATIYQQMLDY